MCLNNLDPVWFRSNSIFSFLFSVLITQTQNSLLNSQTPLSLKNCKIMFRLSSQFPISTTFPPNSWAPPLTLPSVASVATRVSLMKNPLLPLLFSSALLLSLLLLLYFSRLKESPCSASRLSLLTSHIDARRHQSRYFL